MAVGGQAAAWLDMGAKNEGSWGEESVLVSDTDTAIDLLRTQVRPGDVVLVKASRAMGLERVAAALAAESGAAEGKSAESGSAQGTTAEGEVAR